LVDEKLAMKLTDIPSISYLLSTDSESKYGLF